MKRYLAVIAMAASMVGMSAGAASAAWPTHAPLTQEQAVRQVELCAGNPVAGLCTDPFLTARASAQVFAITADNKAVKAICSAHKLYTHTYRMGFCRDYIYVAAGTTATNVAHNWSTAGVIDRAAVVHGFIPGQSS